jgi:hypothetical protein
MRLAVPTAPAPIRDAGKKGTQENNTLATGLPTGNTLYSGYEIPINYFIGQLATALLSIPTLTGWQRTFTNNQSVFFLFLFLIIYMPAARHVLRIIC